MKQIQALVADLGIHTPVPVDFSAGLGVASDALALSSAARRYHGAWTGSWFCSWCCNRLLTAALGSLARDPYNLNGSLQKLLQYALGTLQGTLQ